MEVAKLLVLPVVSALFVLSLHFITKIVSLRHRHLPPGTFGWPIVGETFEFLRAGLDGNVSGFIQGKVEKYGSKVYKTSMLGEPIIVFSDPAGKRFLFTNENKNVQAWWPASVRKLVSSSVAMKVGDEAKNTRKLLMTFLSPEVLRKYLPKMDAIAQRHITSRWQGKDPVVVHTAVKLYTFEVACCLFLSIEDPDHLSSFSAKFHEFLKGIVAFPIYLPGTKFYRAKKAADEIRKEIRMIIKKRKVDLEEKKVLPTQDLLSYLLVTPDPAGRFATEKEIIDDILLLLFAGHDTTRSTLTLIMKYLGELPEVHQQVLAEQLEISQDKETGQLLEWEDIQKMKHSWNVVSEVMRISPPVLGAYRVALKDLTYADYTIPKGWKLLWSPCSSNKDPTFFKNPEAFDASRFEGSGPTPFAYVPFGGGPRMCLGQDFARLQLLVFMRNIVTRFKWDLVNPDEKFMYDPMLEPAEGLPIRLHPLHV